jgi:hypothetical protein
MAADGDVWHLVEARRDDGGATMFRIRELSPRLALAHIFVVELPYPVTALSRLPDAHAYRKLALFEDQWVVPACHALGWELVALKIEDGSFFLYMYGAGEPEQLMMKLAPYDAALGFYDDVDPQWGEYSTLRELLDQAKAMPKPRPKPKQKAATTRLRKAAIAKPKTKKQSKTR